MKTQLKKGFTLVEIMIVVVIIGLLAALAIPAFKKVRNTAIEKTIFNDARQLSSGANQYFTENAATSCKLKDIVGPGKFVANLSSGTRFKFQGGVPTANELWTTVLASDAVLLSTSSDTTPANCVFSLGNAGYDASLSSNALIADSANGGYGAANGAAGANYLTFSVETGALLKKGTAGSATLSETDYLQKAGA